MKTLAPSILAADLLHLEQEIKKIENANAKLVHIDIMDGVFVPNISFGMPIISAVRSCTDLVLDVHAMIIEPNRYIDKFIECGADILTLHLEALKHEEVLFAIDKIHGYNKKVGLSIKPGTEVEAIVPYLDLIDMVLIMTVEPGFGGQSFMESTMSKVKFIKDYSIKNNREIDIEVDGGINMDTIKIAKDFGANIFVMGTAFFNSTGINCIEDLLNEI